MPLAMKQEMLIVTMQEKKILDRQYFTPSNEPSLSIPPYDSIASILTDMWQPCSVNIVDGSVNNNPRYLMLFKRFGE